MKICKGTMKNLGFSVVTETSNAGMVNPLIRGKIDKHSHLKLRQLYRSENNQTISY